MFTFSRRVLGAAVAVALVSGGLTVADATGVQAAPGDPLSFSISASPAAGFSAGQQITFTFTATNSSGAVLDFPASAAVRAVYEGQSASPAPPSTGCQPGDSFAYATYSLVEYNFDLPDTLAAGASLTCQISYPATAWDVSHGGAWTRVHYEPDTASGEWAPGWAWRTISATSPASPGVWFSGTPTVGQKVFALEGGYWGEWNTATTWQWYRDGVAIVGGTQDEYIIASADAGTILSATIGGLNYEDGSVITQSGTMTQRVVRPMSAPTPGIYGTAQVGGILTATTGTWRPAAALTYQWFASGVPIAGATAKTFTVTQAQHGTLITVAVTGTLDGYATLTKTSGHTSRIVGTLFGPTPGVYGTPKVGRPLTAVVGTWTPGTTLAYQWFAGGVAVWGATAKTFTPTAAQVGKVMAVKVTGTQTGYAKLTKTSAPSAKVVR
ncbi:hypothetical protein GCM10027029_34180 [Conyzicola lurida]